MNIAAVIHNERIKGLAGIADSIAVAFAVAAGAKFYQAPSDTFDVSLGLDGMIAYLFAGLYLRQLLRPED